MKVDFVDELDEGFGWLEDTSMRRTSHALAVDGRVWVIDPIDGEGVEQRIRALGDPAGVIQLLDRHARDGEAFAERLGVRHHVVPSSLPGAPFELIRVLRSRWWQEVALWWPEPGILVCGDALGTIPFFRAGDERAGLHPFLRIVPPRALAGLEVRHLLVGHGPGIHDAAAGRVVDTAVRGGRRRIPRWLAGVPRIVREGY